MFITKGYLAFMDHSITEQLIGDSTAWHTTAIALSEGDEVSQLALSISKKINPKNPILKKWSAGRGQRKKKYRTSFARELIQQLPNSSVYIFVISATEEVIVNSRDQILDELRISHLCKEELRGRGTPWFRAGPFKHFKTGEEHYFEFPLNRALMLLWISHFVSRMHSMLHTQLELNQTSKVILDWFFYLDKFAGDSKDSSPSIPFFQTLVTGNINNGNIRSGFFNESDTVNADLFSDNVAGLFNDLQKSPSDYSDLNQIFESGSIHYEVTRPTA